MSITTPSLLLLLIGACTLQLIAGQYPQMMHGQYPPRNGYPQQMPYPSHHGNFQPGYNRFPAPVGNQNQPGSQQSLDLSTLTVRERQCYDILMALENGDLTAFDVDNPNRYIQHNAMIPDGKEGLLQFMQQGLGTTKVKVIRIYQDGDFVFAHTNYTFGPTQATMTIVGFDVWRYDENNLIFEHWDNLQTPPTAANPSGRTMLDGPVQATDLQRTEANKELVRMYANSQVKGPLRTDLLSPNLIQHDPTIGDGVQALTRGLATSATQGKAVSYSSIFLILGKGNFVLVMAPGMQGTTSVGYYDMYRVENGKIAEQWKVVEVIPPRSQWVNQNGKFNGF